MLLKKWKKKKKQKNKHHIFKYMHFYIHKNSRLFILARALQRNINLKFTWHDNHSIYTLNAQQHIIQKLSLQCTYEPEKLKWI